MAVGKAKKIGKRSGLLWAVLLVLCLGAVGACSDQGSDSSSAAASSSSAAPSQTVQGALSFTVECSDWDRALDGEFVVKAEGQTETGMRISEKFRAVPDQRYDTGLSSGHYTFTLAEETTANGGTLKAEPVTVAFNGSDNENAVIVAVPDAAAIEQAEREARERQAAEEAEAQRRAEEEAAAQRAAAEAEAARVAQEQALAAQAASTSGSVYIAASGNGSKYHSNPNCSKMKGTITLSVGEAQSQGYTPCKKCYG